MPCIKLPIASWKCWMLFLCLTPLPAARADGPTTALSGQVVDAKGAAVAGADVILAGPSTSEGVPTVARGKTDADGRFKLDRPADLAGDGVWRPVNLWAWQSGRRLGRIAYLGPLPGPEETVRVEMPSSPPAEYQVEGPGSEPVAGAKVRAVVFAQLNGGLPAELFPKLAATTDADGRATFDSLASEDIIYVHVEAGGLGIQQRAFQPPLPGPKRIVLFPAGEVDGRFVTEGGRPWKKWTVSASTFSKNVPGGSAGQTNNVPVAEDGTFRFPAIAAGSLHLRVKWPDGPDPDMLPDWKKGLAVVAGQDNRVEIPVRPATPITGVIRERGTGAPVPGVKLYMFRQGESQGADTTTDAEGKFRYTSLPGKARIGINEVPPSYIRSPAAFRDEFVVPAPPGHVELPPVELAKAAPPLRGVVRDATGAPVNGASVTGGWSQTENGSVLNSADVATSDAEGRFVLNEIAPDVQVSLTASKGAMSTTTPVMAQAGQDKEIRLTLVQGPTVSITGKVVASDGTPLPDAAVHINARTRRPENGGFDNWRGASGWLYTGPDGTFHVPEALKHEGDEFQAEAVANGYLKLQGPWTAAGDVDVVRLPDLVLRPEPVSRLAGRVVDIAGAPIAGARVLQRGDGPRPTEAKTDADGRFRLPGVAGAQALIAAEAPGFRFGGAIAGAGRLVEIRLSRVDEAVKLLVRAPEPLTRVEERTLGLALLEPTLDEVRSARQVVDFPSPDAILARLAPDRVMPMLEDRVLRQPSAALVQIALYRFEDDPAAALATLNADRSAMVRAYGTLALADLAAVYAPERRADLLDRATAEARRIDKADTKVLLFGEIADRWLETFDIDRAAPILREGDEILKTAKLPNFAPLVTLFGETLAAVDPPAAEALLAKHAMGGPNNEGVRMRERGAMAIRMAAADPAAAEHLAGELHNLPNYSRTQADLLRIARGMARADLPRARKVLDLFDRPPALHASDARTLKAYGLALLAEARAETDPDGARVLLDEAFAALRARAELHPAQATSPPVASIMAGLLPLVERLQPDRVSERLWLAVACRPGRPELLDVNQVTPLLGLALLVSRYDREMAAVIYAPVSARFPELAGQENGGLSNSNDGRDPLKILAAYAPRDLATLIERLPASARVALENAGDWVRPSSEIQARLTGAEMLGLPPEARRHAAMASPFGVWPVESNGRSGREWP